MTLWHILEGMKLVLRLLLFILCSWVLKRHFREQKKLFHGMSPELVLGHGLQRERAAATILVDCALGSVYPIFLFPALGL